MLSKQCHPPNAKRSCTLLTPTAPQHIATAPTSSNHLQQHVRTQRSDPPLEAKAKELSPLKPSPPYPTSNATPHTEKRNPTKPYPIGATAHSNPIPQFAFHVKRNHQPASKLPSTPRMESRADPHGEQVVREVSRETQQSAFQDNPTNGTQEICVSTPAGRRKPTLQPEKKAAQHGLHA